ncbi:maintenance of mitochondrial structure and function-domain-containing protein [Scheffersomyces coipomensis]|uniref:maintenance of mitochondrial structure and function-domain-containing protein n=1 Tax=Scheffersomyces coipomensis TaxID=1788519 RepID=UPI00315D601F
MSNTGTTTNELTFLNKTVTVSPLVLLSVVDHFNRVAKDSKKRVVGVILGDNSSDIIKVTNSYAIPFEEDEKNSNVWFLDHNFIDSMGEMFKKINAKERLIGWYHSGPKLKPSDLKINEVFKKYTSNPLLLIVDVQPREVGIPTDAYYAVDDIKNDGSAAEKTFVHVPSLIEAEEAEEIGVEHLLRDIRDQAAGNLSLKVSQTYQSLLGLHQKLREIANYLDKVYSKNLPINHTILGKLQNVFNLLPSLGGADDSKLLFNNSNSVKPENSSNPLSTAFTVKTNDQLMIVYISTLVRAIIAFHDLIENKLENKKLNEKNNADLDPELDGVNGSISNLSNEEKGEGVSEDSK